MPFETGKGSKAASEGVSREHKGAQESTMRQGRGAAGRSMRCLSVSA